MPKLSSRSAFTLVELIVVIAILVILSTVGFVGYSQYSVSSRDGARVSDMKTIYSALKIVQSKTGQNPTPDNALQINNGSWKLHALQGVVGSGVRNTIDLESGGRDPQSGKPYTYYRFSDKKHIQLLGFFEAAGYQEKLADAGFGESAYATDNKDLIPVTIGTKLGVALDTASMIPLNETMSGTITLASLAASGATVVGSPLAAGANIVVTPGMLAALSSPLVTNGAVVMSLQEQLFGSGSTYTTGWTSNGCDPNAISVIEVNTSNYTNYFPVNMVPNTIYQLAPDDYPIAIWTNISIPSCSAVVSSSSGQKARIWSGHPTNYTVTWNWSASPVCWYNFVTTGNNSIIDGISFKYGPQDGFWLPVGLCAGSNSTFKNADFELSARTISYGNGYQNYAIVPGSSNTFMNVTNNGNLYSP